MKSILCAMSILLFTSIAKAEMPERFESYLIDWEGYTHRPVHRPNGEVVIGVGHNTRFDQSVKAIYTDEEIQELFLNDYNHALQDVRGLVVNFDSLSENIRFVCLSLMWTVGRQGFADFVDFRDAIDAHDYKKAAKALLNSKWSRQVGSNRLQDHINRLKHPYN